MFHKTFLRKSPLNFLILFYLFSILFFNLFSLFSIKKRKIFLFFFFKFPFQFPIPRNHPIPHSPFPVLVTSVWHGKRTNYEVPCHSYPSATDLFFFFLKNSCLFDVILRFFKFTKYLLFFSPCSCQRALERTSFQFHILVAQFPVLLISL